MAKAPFPPANHKAKQARPGRGDRLAPPDFICRWRGTEEALSQFLTCPQLDRDNIDSLTTSMMNGS
jgi:hypothetical protein